MGSPGGETGTVAAAIDHARNLLEANPALAAEQAREILSVAPLSPEATLLLAQASRKMGDNESALDLLSELTLAQPKWADAHFEFGVSLGVAGRGDDAIAALQQAVNLRGDHPHAWRFLADHLMAYGRSEEGDAAYAQHIKCSSRDPVLQRAALAMVDNDVAVAERLLKTHLKKTPTDVPAIRMLAEVAIRCGQNQAAENLLHRCLELAPGFSAARYNYAVLLQRQNDSEAAMTELEILLQEDPRSPSYRNLAAVILSRIGEFSRSSKMYAELLEEYPSNAKVWLSYGHVLKTEGRQEDCIDAYRRSIACDPEFGEAYWSLANLKTFRFNSNDLRAMRHQLDNSELDEEHRLHMHFALGKAAEDADDYSVSFQHYASGNALQSASLKYDAELNTARAQTLKRNFTGQLFRERAGSGCISPDPIFIVGMPRSGSTLLEQILSCHSAVEGTTELPDIITMAKDLRNEANSDEIAAYSEVLAGKSSAELRELGEQYLTRTRVHRKTDRPLFIDKMPNNFLHVGMIHLVLPNAKIIDARRHPLGCCFSNFKQYYARGQSFSYDLTDMGGFYKDYVELMAHYDQVLPDRVHRVFYEQTVSDTEAVVRELLDYCELPFEPACLRFFESDRPVRTASSEQVRQPIYADGTQQWQHYEQWLGPLKESLGDLLDSYPLVPGRHDL